MPPKATLSLRLSNEQGRGVNITKPTHKIEEESNGKNETIECIEAKAEREMLVCTFHQQDDVWSQAAEVSALGDYFRRTDAMDESSQTSLFHFALISELTSYSME